MSKCQSEAENGTAAEKKSRDRPKGDPEYIAEFVLVWSVTGAVSLLHFRLIELTES